MEYWVLHCGVDGYLYVLFQRRMLKLSVSLAAIMFIFSVLMNLNASTEASDSRDDKASFAFFLDKATLSNRELTNYRSWYHVLLVTIITALSIRMIAKTRRLARQAYALQKSWVSLQHDSEELKHYTVHIKGIPAEDRMGNGLKAILDEFLQARGGRVVAIQIVPPFHKMVEIEMKTRNLKDIQMMALSSEQPFFCCVPSKYLEVSKFEEKLDRLEEKLIDETLKPFEPSGHAFVCLDSVESVKACEDRFKVGAFDYVRFTCYLLKKQLTTCFGLVSGELRDRSNSTFTRFEYLDEQEII